MTANAFMSVSLEPPLVLISVDRRTKMCGLLHEGSTYGVSVLCESQSTLSDRFAGRSGLRRGRAALRPHPRHAARRGRARRVRLQGRALLLGRRPLAVPRPRRVRAHAARARRCCSTAAATSGSARATATERPVTRAADATGPPVRRQLDWDGLLQRPRPRRPADRRRARRPARRARAGRRARAPDRDGLARARGPRRADGRRPAQRRRDRRRRRPAPGRAHDRAPRAGPHRGPRVLGPLEQRPGVRHAAVLPPAPRPLRARLRRRRRRDRPRRRRAGSPTTAPAAATARA